MSSPRASGSEPAGQAGTPGIDWYAGDVGGAFELAGREHKPVFLYWGAKWCPPCQQLKSSVFSRSDFIAKTRQFIAVYLDGDEPGAQKWGETFRVRGYPTVVILRPDRREVTRISGGMDLSLYADLLDIAQSDIRPVADVMAALQAGSALSHADCQRLAYYAWELVDYSADERSKVGTALAGAAKNCAGITPVERARLTVTATILSIAPESVAQISAILGDADLAARVADVLEGLDSPFFAAVLAQGPASSEKFRRDWERTMNEVANDAHRIDADQLVAIGAKLSLVRQFAAPGRLSDDLVADARRRTTAALAAKTDPYVRAGVVNAVSYIYEQLDDDAAQESLLRGELLSAKAPYYYMADLGELEEKRGRSAEALAWYARAYHESQGAATRFQWGNIYLGALLRLAPTDRKRIRETAAAVIADLDGPDRIHARTRLGLEKLDGRLRQWNAEHHFDADLRDIRTRMQRICSRLHDDAAGLTSCRNFLSGAA
ncbi:MAG: thioredoxin family protein [Steroidobacterales bacterium]